MTTKIKLTCVQPFSPSVCSVSRTIQYDIHARTHVICTSSQFLHNRVTQLGFWASWLHSTQIELRLKPSPPVPLPATDRSVHSIPQNIIMYTYPEQETSKRMRKIAPAESESETCPNCHSYSPPLCNNNGLVAGQSHWAKLLPDNDKLLQHSIGRTHATNGCFNQMAAAGTGNILLSSYPSSSTFKLPQSSSSKQVSRQLLHSSRGVSFSFAGFSLVALTGVALLVIGLCTTLSSGAGE